MSRANREGKAELPGECPSESRSLDHQRPAADPSPTARVTGRRSLRRLAVPDSGNRKQEARPAGERSSHQTPRQVTAQPSLRVLCRGSPTTLDTDWPGCLCVSLRLCPSTPVTTEMVKFSSFSSDHFHTNGTHGPAPQGSGLARLSPTGSRASSASDWRVKGWGWRWAGGGEGRTTKAEMRLLWEL